MLRPILCTRDRAENMTEALTDGSYSQERGVRQTQRNSQLILASE